jgi:PKD repeat protein
LLRRLTCVLVAVIAFLVCAGASYLRVVKSSYSIGDCDSTISATARSPDGTIWGVDQGDGKDGLWKSTDDLASWQLVYEASDYRSVEEVLPLASGHLLIVVVDAQNIRHVLRSTGTDGTAFGAPVLDLPPGALLHDPQSWVETGNAIYIAEYGDPAYPVVVWKSTDDGQTFSVSYARYSDARHYHSIQPDPYHAGRLWLDVGDSNTEPRIGYSDDGASTFSWITEVTYPQSRALDMMFAPEAVYWAADSGDEPTGMYAWDRHTGTITRILKSLNGPFYNTFSANGVYAQFSAVEQPIADGYVGDDYIHVITSREGASWSATRTPFRRLIGDTRQTAYMTHFTPPDSQGRFWGSFFDLDGTEYKNSNIQFQLDPSATFTGPTSSFSVTPASLNPGDQASFDGSASSSPHPPLAYDWDFGDGSTATGAVASHSYSAPGTYTARLQVTDANGDANESHQTVVVSSGQPSAPVAATSAASGVDHAGATLNGNVNPSGLATTAHFEYGTSTNYGSSTPDQDLGSGSATLPVSAALTGLTSSTTYHYRVVATNSAGTSRGQDATFTTSAAPVPVATTAAASGVSTTAATLNGSANPNGSATSAHFEYGTTTSYGNSTPDQDLGGGSSAVATSAPLSGLAPSTTYHYRLVATNSFGTSYGADTTFTTSAAVLPSATTNAASGVTASTATLNGSVNPNGVATTARFEYGTTTSYGTQTPDQDVGSGTAARTVSGPLTGLNPRTTYHYRIVASNAFGTVRGADRTFTTGAPSAPSVTTNAANAVTYSSATLNGTVNPKGFAAFAQFEYGLTTAYGSTTAPQDVGSGTTALAVSAALAGLSPHTTYHFRITATNPYGTTRGSDKSFTTGPLPPVAATGAPTNVTSTSARFNATVNPGGGATTYYFQYGTTTAYGTLTSKSNAGSGTADVAVSAPSKTLLRNTLYHVRVVATNASGTTFGQDVQFNTNP